MNRLRHFLFALFVFALVGAGSAACAEYTMPYRILVDLSQQVVVIYDTSDGLPGTPYKYMICSSGKSGTGTIKGKFYMAGTPAQSWCAFPGCYVRYPTRIKGGYYFHSILYSSRNPASLNAESWRKLGSPASHGCIRLAPIDSQWINYNCKKGTLVEIRASSGLPLRTIHDNILKEYKQVLGHAGVQPTLAPTPTPVPPTLNPGDSNSRVKILKNYLKQHGYYDGSTASPLYDDATVAAWNEYQKARGWAEDGIATPDEQYTLATDTENVGLNRNLVKGSTGIIVKKVEEQLKKLGFFRGTPGTTYDSDTVSAVKKFQQAAALAANGKADSALQKLLFSSAAPTPTPMPPLSLGSRGSSVKKLQSRLLSLGFLVGSANGKFTLATQRAVELYQTAAGISVTGSADNALQLRIATDDTLTGTARTLKKGSTGVVVLAFKTRLFKLGYLSESAVSTSYTSGTASVVKKFQKACGLAPSGVATPTTQLKAIALTEIGNQD